MGTINSSDKIAATLYSLRNICTNTLHKGDSDDDDDNNNINNNNNPSSSSLSLSSSFPSPNIIFSSSCIFYFSLFSPLRRHQR
jgi:hypothetical protein